MKFPLFYLYFQMRLMFLSLHDSSYSEHITCMNELLKPDTLLEMWIVMILFCIISSTSNVSHSNQGANNLKN